MNGLQSGLRLTRRFFTENLNYRYPGMERWKERIAIVTGASAGMGYELTKTLAELGVVVVGCARNTKSIEECVCVCVCVCVFVYVCVCLCVHSDIRL